MRIFTEEQRRRKLKHAYKRTVETGKDHVGTAINLMSQERQKAHREFLDNDTPSKESLTKMMDEVVRESSGGKFQTWLELEQSLPPTSSNCLRLFNIGASLQGYKHLVDPNDILKKLDPYIKMLQTLYGSEATVKLRLERKPD